MFRSIVLGSDRLDCGGGHWWWIFLKRGSDWSERSLAGSNGSKWFCFDVDSCDVTFNSDCRFDELIDLVGRSLSDDETLKMLSFTAGDFFCKYWKWNETRLGEWKWSGAKLNAIALGLSFRDDLIGMAGDDRSSETKILLWNPCQRKKLAFRGFV